MARAWRLATEDTALGRARGAAIARELRDVADEGRDVEIAPASDPRGALLGGAADIAVTAMADAIRQPSPGPTASAVPMRLDPRDALVSRDDKVMAYLPQGARIAAPGSWRVAQLLRRRSDLHVVDAGPDVERLLSGLAAGEFEALVTASADLAMLGALDEVAEYFDTDQLIPTPGQATVLLEARADDRHARALIEPVNDTHSAYAAAAERACFRRLGEVGDTPVGVYALTDGTTMFVHGIVANRDGRSAARLRWTGPWRKAEEVGETLAELLLTAGGSDIIAGRAVETIDFAADRQRRIEEEWTDEDRADAQWGLPGRPSDT